MSDADRSGHTGAAPLPPVKAKGSGYDFLNKLTNLLPLISVVLFVVSFLKQYVYYRIFHINIIPYITTSELFIGLMYNFLSLMFQFMVCMLLGGIVVMLYNFFSLIFGKKTAVVIICLISIPIMVISLTIVDVLLVEYLDGYYMTYILISMIAGYLVSFFFSSQFFEKIDEYTFAISLVLLGVLTAHIIEPIQLAREFKKKPQIHNSYISFKDADCIEPNSKTYLIGITSEYALFFNDSLQKPEIRNRSDIKLLRVGVLPLDDAGVVLNTNNETKLQKYVRTFFK